MDDDARRRMVRGLLARNVASGTSSDGTAGASDEAPAVGQDLNALVEAMYDTTSQPPAWLEAATLAVTPEEMTFIEGLAPLLGTTPRSVKRFVNMFQLVKTIARAHGPVSQESVEQLLFLLAVSTGPPETAGQLFSAIEQSTASRPLATVVRGLSSPEAIETWLKGYPAWRRLRVAELRPWLDSVRRFWFRAAQASPATAPAPPGAASGGARAGP